MTEKFVIWTNTFCNWVKYILKFKLNCFAIWTNILARLSLWMGNKINCFNKHVLWYLLVDKIFVNFDKYSPFGSCLKNAAQVSQVNHLHLKSHLKHLRFYPLQIVDHILTGLPSAWGRLVIICQARNCELSICMFPPFVYLQNVVRRKGKILWNCWAWLIGLGTDNVFARDQQPNPRWTKMPAGPFHDQLISPIRKTVVFVKS